MAQLVTGGITDATARPACLVSMLWPLSATNLAVHRLAPEAFDRGTALLWINFAVAAAGLIVAVIAFPPPPILALAVAVAAFARGLLVARRPLS